LSFKRRSNAAIAALLLVTFIWACGGLTAFNLKDTKWRSTTLEVGAVFLVNLHADKTAMVTLTRIGYPDQSYGGTWSAEGKELTLIWSTGRFEGTVRNKQITGRASNPSNGTSIAMTLVKD
jgi:hypothetical protein